MSLHRSELSNLSPRVITTKRDIS